MSDSVCCKYHELLNLARYFPIHFLTVRCGVANIYVLCNDSNQRLLLDSVLSVQSGSGDVNKLRKQVRTYESIYNLSKYVFVSGNFCFSLNAVGTFNENDCEVLSTKNDINLCESKSLCLDSGFCSRVRRTIKRYCMTVAVIRGANVTHR